MHQRAHTPIIVAAILAVASCISMLTPSEAVADEHTGGTKWIIKKTEPTERPHHLDTVGSIWMFGDQPWLGVGLWYAFPALKQGIIPQINDSLDIEVGGFINMINRNAHGDHTLYAGIMPLGGVRWMFHLHPDWSVFATAKLGFQVGLGSSAVNGLAGGGSVGAYWRITDLVYLRMETGNLGLIQVGLSFTL